MAEMCPCSFFELSQGYGGLQGKSFSAEPRALWCFNLPLQLPANQVMATPCRLSLPCTGGYCGDEQNTCGAVLGAHMKTIRVPCNIMEVTSVLPLTCSECPSQGAGFKQSGKHQRPTLTRSTEQKAQGPEASFRTTKG